MHALSRRHVLAGVAGLAVTLAGRAAAQTSAGGAPILVYSAAHRSLAESWADAFTKESGIAVTLRHGSDSELANQIVLEGAGSPADLFLTENSPGMVLVDNAKLFAELPADIVEQVAAERRPSHRRWTSIAARSTVLVYDKRKLKPAQMPASLMDLAKPEWKGRWAASPGGADFQAIVSAVLALKGDAETAAWLKGMKANARIYRGNSAAMKAVNAGEVETAVVYHYYYFGDQAKTGENSGNIGMHYFRGRDPGAFISISGGGVLASSKRQERALRFLKFVTGKGGQDILRTGDRFEYAVGAGAASHPKLVPLAELEPPVVDAAGLNSRKVTDLMTAAGLL